MAVVGQVEIDPWCRSVLAKHWPEVPRHGDVRTGDSVMFSETWPSSGMTRNGIAYRLPSSVPPIYATASGLWPTPRTTGLDGGSNSRKAAKARGMWPTLTFNDALILSGDMAMPPTGMWPSPTANRWSGLQSRGNNALLGQLNPTWVEWLMGYPAGWTGSEDSATPSSPR